MEVVRHCSLPPPGWAAPSGISTCTAPVQTYAPASLKDSTPRTKEKQGSKLQRQRQRRHAADAEQAPEQEQAPPPNPADYAPLRCSWPHPGAVSLVAQQCWPAEYELQQAGGQGSSGPAAMHPLQSGNLWRQMLPALSLLHPPSLQGQADAGSSSVSLPLESPKVLVGYQEDWLEVPPASLPMWASAPFEPYGMPRPLLTYALCPEELVAPASLFLRDVTAFYEACNLGTHTPAAAAGAAGGSTAAGSSPSGGPNGLLQTFSTTQQPAGLLTVSQQPPLQQTNGAVNGSPGSGAGPPSASAWESLPALQRYLLCLRSACQRLQRQLLMDPPLLRASQGSTLEARPSRTVVVYLVCPFRGQEELLAAVGEAATWLGPLTSLGTSLEEPACTGGGGGGGNSNGASSSAALELDVGGLLDALVQEPAQQRQKRQRRRQRQPEAAPAVSTPAGGGGRRVLYAPGSASPGQGSGDIVAAPAPTAVDRGGKDAAATAAAAAAAAATDPGEQRYSGAAAGAYVVQRGDFRRLPPRVLPRKGDGKAAPLDVVIQVVGLDALEDVSGAAAKATAFLLYSKAALLGSARWAALQQHARQQPRSLLCSAPQPSAEPLIALTPASVAAAGAALLRLHRQQALLHSGQGQPDGSAAGQPAVTVAAGSSNEQAAEHRALHCAYALPRALQPGAASGGNSVSGSSLSIGGSERLLVPVVWTDSCGELLRYEVFRLGGGSSSSSRRQHTKRRRQLSMEELSSLLDAPPAAELCRLVADRSSELACQLNASASPAAQLQRLVVCRVGAADEAERAAWRALCEERVLLGDAPGSHSLPLAVLEVQADPPARLAALDRPHCCTLTLHGSASSGGRVIDPAADPAARIIWSSSADTPAALLVGEHNIERTLHLELTADSSSSGGGGSSVAGFAADTLLLASAQLQGLAVLHAAFYEVGLGSICAPGGTKLAGRLAVPADAHLPLHAALAQRLADLLSAAGTITEG